MSRGNKIDWWPIGLTAVAGTTFGFLILGLGDSKAPWWMWATIPMWSFLMGLTFQVISPTGPPKRWFKDE